MKKKARIECPFCAASEVKRNGYSPKREQRYQCKKCKYTFSKRTGTLVHALKKPELFKKFAEEISDGYKTLKSCSAEYGIAVSTAFSWRHKVLSAYANPEREFEGILEMTTMEISHCRKGIKNAKAHFSLNNRDESCKIFLSTDYHPHYNCLLQFLSIGKIHTDFVSQHLKNQIRKKNIIPVSPYNTFIEKLARVLKLQGKISYIDNNDQNAPTELQRTIGLKSKILEMITSKTRGIATKYLDNYFSWLSLIEQFATPVERKSEKALEGVLLKKRTWAKHIFHEKICEEFYKLKSSITYSQSNHFHWKSEKKYNLKLILS